MDKKEWAVELLEDLRLVVLKLNQCSSQLVDGDIGRLEAAKKVVEWVDVKIKEYCNGENHVGGQDVQG